MNAETALAHIETFIAGGDELGEFTEDDALTALDALRAEVATLRAENKRLTGQLSEKQIFIDVTVEKFKAELRRGDALRAENERLANPPTLAENPYYAHGVSDGMGYQKLLVESLEAEVAQLRAELDREKEQVKLNRDAVGVLLSAAGSDSASPIEQAANGIVSLRAEVAALRAELAGETGLRRAALSEVVKLRARLQAADELADDTPRLIEYAQRRAIGVEGASIIADIERALAAYRARGGAEESVK